jgi:hypothetical protein
MQEPLLVVVEDALLDMAAPLELVEPELVTGPLEMVELDVAAPDPFTLAPLVPPPTPVELPPDPAPLEEPQAIALTHAAAPARRTDARNDGQSRVLLWRSESSRCPRTEIRRMLGGISPTTAAPRAEAMAFIPSADAISAKLRHEPGAGQPTDVQGALHQLGLPHPGGSRPPSTSDVARPATSST